MRDISLQLTEEAHGYILRPYNLYILILILHTHNHYQIASFERARSNQLDREIDSINATPHNITFKKKCNATPRLPLLKSSQI